MTFSDYLKLFEDSRRVKTVGQLIDALDKLPRNTPVEYISLNINKESDIVTISGSYKIVYRD